jgi:hypothetical protein
MCPMNCHPTLCGMLATVEDGRLLERAGRPRQPRQPRVPVRPGPGVARDHRQSPPAAPAAGPRAPGRGRLACASWDDALDLIADRMRAAGREAVGLWSGHGLFANNYGTRVGSHLLRRFANLWGCQWWHPSMICWGLGGFGLGLTGVLEANTKGGHGGARPPRRALGRQPREPAEHRAAPWSARAAGRPRDHDRRAPRRRRRPSPTRPF